MTHRRDDTLLRGAEAPLLSGGKTRWSLEADLFTCTSSLPQAALKS